MYLDVPFFFSTESHVYISLSSEYRPSSAQAQHYIERKGEQGLGWGKSGALGSEKSDQNRGMVKDGERHPG